MKKILSLILSLSILLAFPHAVNATNLFSFPNSALTPGKTLNITMKQICTNGYTKTVRDVSTATKKQVFKEYGISYASKADYELDHFIPLELGGSNDIKNLWPELGASPNPKDKVEDYLHTQLCSNKISLQKAQNEITTDWYTVYLAISASKNVVKTPLRTKVILNTPAPTTVTNSTTTINTNTNQNNGATALCIDGTYSYAAHHQGACSHHGGVATFYN